MRTLSNMEVQQISGADYSGLEVIAISAGASGLAFGAIKAYHSWSFMAGLSPLFACAVPTAVMSGLIVGTVEMVNWLSAGDGESE